MNLVVILTIVLFRDVSGNTGNFNHDDDIKLDMSQSMETRLSYVEKTTSAMLNRIVELEKNEVKLTDENRELQARIDELEKDRSTTDSVSDVTGNKEEREFERQVVGAVEKTHDIRNVVRSKHDRHTHNITRASRLVLDDSEGPVAFCAVLAGVGHPHVGIGQPIVYNELVTNIGGGLHMAHGLFTAPRSGIYMISTSVMSLANNNLRAAIVINGKSIVKAYAEGAPNTYVQGSQVVVVQLNKGDDVAVEAVQVADVHVYGDQFTSFSGYLLFPM